MEDNLKKEIKILNQHPENHQMAICMPPCDGVIPYSDENCYPDPFPVKHSQTCTSSRALREEAQFWYTLNSDITNGGMGFKFLLLHRLFEKTCFDINKDTHCISKTEDSLFNKHTLGIY